MNELTAALRRRSLLIPLAACLVVNGVCLLQIQANHPQYLVDDRTSPNPDAPHYALLGRNFYQHGAFSRSPKPPFIPDVFRTPLYPLFAGGLELLGGPLLVYLAQIVLHMGICILIYAITARLFDTRAAAVVTFIVAIHPTLISSNFQVMSEILFLFLLLLSVWILIRYMQPGTALSWRPAFWAGFILGLSILVRPIGLILPMLVAAYLFAVGGPRRDWRAAARSAVAYALGALLVTMPWIARNKLLYDIGSLSTADAAVIVYYTGAGAYQVHYGVELEEAQGMIAKEYHLHTCPEICNYFALGLSASQMDHETRRAIPQVLLRYPGALVKASSMGLLKAYFSHDASLWALILHRPWNRPGFSQLVKLQPAAWSRLFSNGIFLVAMFFVQLGLSVLLVGAAAWGAVTVIVRRRDRERFYLLLALLGVFLLICAASGYDAYSRFTVPSLPFVCIFAGAIFASRSGGAENGELRGAREKHAHRRVG